MKHRFFWISAMNPEVREQDLNQFLSSRRIVHIERHFVSAPTPGWTVCVEYLDSEEVVSVKKRETASVDYREILDTDTFTLFAAMRAWRNTKAKEQGVQAYTLASNEQLAEIAKARCRSQADLEKIKGFGEVRIKKYGADLLEILAATYPNLIV